MTYATGQLVAALPFKPAGGLGAAEVTFVSTFALLGVSPVPTAWAPVALSSETGTDLPMRRP